MSTPSPCQRVFLGSDGPALHAAASWLLSTLGGSSADLGGVLVVVPGSRAQRRLQELLAEQAEGLAMVPPTVVTLGAMVDRLMLTEGPAVASELASVLAWASVLREADGQMIEQVLPQAPQRDDWPGWWSLAEQVVQASSELGAQLVEVGDVAGRIGHLSDEARWSALGQLSIAYAQQLKSQGLIDRHQVRARAIAQRSFAWDGPVVLLATADLQPVHVHALSSLDSPVYALIAAEDRDEAGFDEFGGLISSYWAARDIEIDDEAIRMVDRPNDQALAVVDAVRGWSEAGGVSADQITVGLGDDALSGPIARALGLLGLPVRSAKGRPMSGARPVLLLRALGQFGSGLRFDALAELLRHPDAEALIAERSGEPTRAWLTMLDRYASDHLAARPTSGWLGDEAEVRSMEAVYRAALSLLPDPAGKLLPLNAWPAIIGGALFAIYGGRALSRYAEQDRAVVAALEKIGGVLEQITRLGEAVPHCTFAQAVTLIVGRISSESIPEPGGEPAIELVGYLELLLDDAPRLAIAGMNEQSVPAPPRYSALLSEGVRRAIGLPGDEHRLARDAYALDAMLGWREGVRLIAGRRLQAGDPLLPSRLLLKAEDDTLVRRVSDFVAEQGENVAAPMLLTPGKVDRFLIPRPVLPPVPINSLSVTAFRDYLACPYRFYLNHVLRLRPMDDRVRELTAAGFGILAHDALKELARGELSGVDDVAAIRQRLGKALDRAMVKAYGSHAPAAAQIQAEQLRYRLEVYAEHHVAMMKSGWRIAHQEHLIDSEVVVDGRPFTIRGKIDRIDRHPEEGWRLIDYKTSETAESPDKKHRKKIDGVVQWVDLQLPLYLDLAAKLCAGGKVELGYINLPKKQSGTGYAPAEWSAHELDEARACRDFVIRQVRAGVFWPPMQTVDYDGYAGVCADAIEDRQALIIASSRGVKP